MKITVNYISNVFLAVILAVLPYTALIKLFIKNNDTLFLNVEMVLIIILNKYGENGQPCFFFFFFFFGF